MPNLTVKNIPEGLYDHLKAAAQLHRRSINSELISCLEQVLVPTRRSPAETLKAARALRAQVNAISPLSADEISEAKNEGRA